VPLRWENIFPESTTDRTEPGFSPPRTLDYAEFFGKAINCPPSAIRRTLALPLLPTRQTTRSPAFGPDDIPWEIHMYMLFVPPVLSFVGIFAISLRTQFSIGRDR
jgi:hypothetical protein